MLVMPANVVRLIHAAVHRQRTGGQSQHVRLSRPFHLLVQQTFGRLAFQQSSCGPAQRVVIRRAVHADLRQPVGTVLEKPLQLAVAEPEQFSNDQTREQLRQREIMTGKLSTRDSGLSVLNISARSIFL